MTHLLASLAAHVDGAVAVVRHDGARHIVEAQTGGGDATTVVGPPLALDAPAALGPAQLGGLARLVRGFAYAVPIRDRVVLVGGEGETERAEHFEGTSHRGVIVTGKGSHAREAAQPKHFRVEQLRVPLAYEPEHLG